MKNELFQVIIEQLHPIMEQLKYSYMEHILQSGHSASGNLAMNQTHSIVFDGRMIKISLNLEPYWKYLENGRKPGKMPPVEKILQWVKVKPVLPRERNGKVPTQKQLAFLIARKIGREGTKPTHLLQKTMDDMKLKKLVTAAVLKVMKESTFEK